MSRSLNLLVIDSWSVANGLASWSRAWMEQEQKIGELVRVHQRIEPTYVDRERER